MSSRWPNDERSTIPVNRDSAWGAVLLVLALAILVLTPPASMSPWIFGTAGFGMLTGLSLIVVGFLKEVDRP